MKQVSLMDMDRRLKTKTLKIMTKFATAERFMKVNLKMAKCMDKVGSLTLRVRFMTDYLLSTSSIKVGFTLFPVMMLIINQILT
jgi:hypothetical protein